MTRKPADLTPLNEHILEIDLEDLTFETLDQRLELSLAAFFDLDAVSGAEQPVAESLQGCSQFSCTGYWPEG